ncbi:MAG: porin [Candidatus Nitrohelix vancouverensis]|uniref:Porin n=1 Tax=Candidatus Nitrohelix vancouverensis TaxID=2705534 RepID=A0A7T0G3I8_9BACT|nr:MAG: porin [Candidatus Nitrohelix vancouverensis]
MNKNPSILSFIFIPALLLCLATGVHANDDLLEVLRDNRTISAEQYEQLKKKREQEASQKNSKGFEFGKKGDDFRLKVGGRIQTDAAFYDENTRFGDGAEVRRVRLELEGRLYRHWRFALGMDYSGNAVSLNDSWLGYYGIRNTNFKIGHFKEPFSLEELSSSKYHPFMERSLANAFVPGRNLGLQASFNGANWTVAVGGFGEGVGDNRVKGEGHGTTARATLSPFGNSMHLGVSGTYRVPQDATSSATIDSRPESHVTSIRTVNTGTISNIDHFTTIGFEWAQFLGALSLQGEYMIHNIERTQNANAQLDGGYVLASWFLTGENRNYSPSKGKFGMIVPNKNFGDGGPGAWEVAFRYSFIDLNDRPITGGQQENYGASVNWYVNPKIRFQLNYQHANTDPIADNLNLNIIQARAQVFF